MPKNKANGKKTNTQRKRYTATKKPIKKEKKKNASESQIYSILTFALALLLLAVILIPGGNFWLFIHESLFGIFGVCTYLVPILIGFLSIMSALGKFNGETAIKTAEGCALLLLVNSAVDIFTAAEGLAFSEHLVKAFNEGIHLGNGGFLGAVIGHPLTYICGGTVGAAIIIFILIFVLLLLLTGTTLVKFFKAITKPVEKLKNARQSEEETIEISAPTKKIKLPKREKNEEKDIDIFITDEEEIAHQNRLTKEKKDKLIDLYNGVHTNKAEPVLPPQPIDDEIPVTQEEYKIDSETGEVIEKINNSQNEIKDVDSVDTLSDAEFIVPNEEEIPVQTYNYPPIDLLTAIKPDDNRSINHELESTGKHLVDVLSSFGVDTKIINISRGPAVTRYELQPCVGVKISKITNLADDIALNLATAGVRIEAPIPNKPAVGIEVPNKNTSVVGVREIIDSDVFKNSKSKLTVALGKDIAGAVTVTDITKMPHGLIAGATGSGKSVCINSIIVSLLYKSTPEEVKLLLIDPKVVELGVYNGIPHLLVPVVTDPRKAAGALGWAVLEMERRYKQFAENDVRNIDGFNALAEHREDLQKMPHIVIIIDELADLMMTAPGDVEDAICRIAQKARAAGMHMIVATQRPSVDVVTGLIKANIPTRVAFSVSSQVDSRTILDIGGAEKLMGRGDMLFYPVGATKPLRIQGCFVSDNEVEKVVEFIKNSGKSDYSEDVSQEIERLASQDKNAKNSKGEDIDNGDDADPMLSQAIDVVVEAGQASTSLLQRRLKLGYARAARIIDQMEARGVVDGYQGSKPRNVLITKDQLNEMKMRSDNGDAEN